MHVRILWKTGFSSGANLNLGLVRSIKHWTRELFLAKYRPSKWLTFHFVRSDHIPKIHFEVGPLAGRVKKCFIAILIQGTYVSVRERRSTELYKKESRRLFLHTPWPLRISRAKLAKSMLIVLRRERASRCYTKVLLSRKELNVKRSVTRQQPCRKKPDLRSPHSTGKCS